MGTIDSRGNVHGAAGTAAAGQFSRKQNSRPAATLDTPARALEGEPADVTGLRDVFAAQLRTDADLRRAIEVMEQQGIDFRVHDPSPEQVAKMVKDAIVAERWRGTPKTGALDEFDVRDVTVMGGDEIRAMTARQRRHLLSQALQAAERLQSYTRELDEPADVHTAHLQVVGVGSTP